MAFDVAKNSDFITNVYGKDEYRVRFGSLDNVILLPTDPSDAGASGLSMHRGGHPRYRDAINDVHDDLLRNYNAELAEIGGNQASATDVERLKQKYRDLHDRFELHLKTGLVAQIPDVSDEGSIRPKYQIYGQDIFLDGVSNEKGWDALYDRVVFIDEISVKTNLTRLRGRSLRCTRLTDSAPFGAWN